MFWPKVTKSKHKTSKVTFLCQKMYESFWFSFSNTNSEEHFCFHHSLTAISHVRIFFSWQFTFPNFYLDIFFPFLLELLSPYSIPTLISFFYLDFYMLNLYTSFYYTFSFSRQNEWFHKIASQNYKLSIITNWGNPIKLHGNDEKWCDFIKLHINDAKWTL